MKLDFYEGVENKMEENKNCMTCKWCEKDPIANVCVNDSSEYCTEWVWEDTICSEYEEEI